MHDVHLYVVTTRNAVFYNSESSFFDISMYKTGRRNVLIFFGLVIHTKDLVRECIF